MYFAICLKIFFALRNMTTPTYNKTNFIQAQYLNVQICIHSTMRYSRFHARLMMSQNAFIPHPLYYWWILFSFNDFLINWHNNDNIIISSSSTALNLTRKRFYMVTMLCRYGVMWSNVTGKSYICSMSVVAISIDDMNRLWTLCISIPWWKEDTF